MNNYYKLSTNKWLLSSLMTALFSATLHSCICHTPYDYPQVVQVETIGEHKILNIANIEDLKFAKGKKSVMHLINIDFESDRDVVLHKEDISVSYDGQPLSFKMGSNAIIGKKENRKKKVKVGQNQLFIRIKHNRFMRKRISIDINTDNM